MLALDRYARPGRAAIAFFAIALVVGACSSAASPTPGAATPEAATPEAGTPPPAATATPRSGGGYGREYGNQETPTPSAAPSEAAGEAAEVNVATAAGIGSFLTGKDGRTLYVFKQDAPDTSNCTGGCASAWPPLTVGAGQSAKAGAGIGGTFGTIARDDGTTQVTYDGAPLYYFGGDAEAGDTNGQGLNGVWFVAQP